MFRRSCPGKVGRDDSVPLRDRATELVKEHARICRVFARQPTHRCEWEGVHGVISPLPDQARNDRQVDRFKCSINRNFSFEPLHVDGPAREEKGAIGIENDVLVPSCVIHMERHGVVNADQRLEATELGRISTPQTGSPLIDELMS